MHVLKAQDLSFSPGETPIIQDINLELNRGELTGLVGPNGAGKSTLLRCLAGFYAPSTGRVLLEGRELSSYLPRQRAQKLSYITQENSQAFPFTVLEVLMMGAYAHLGYWQPPGRETEEQALRALRFVGLEHLREQSFPLLSGGEKQLVLFARTLVQDATILLMDEPTANLDMKHEQNLLSMTRELCSEGRSALVSIHNLDRAAEFCDRIILLDRGRVAASGLPEEVLLRDRLEQVYQTQLHVSRNEATGALGITPSPSRPAENDTRVHLIGGAGSAVNLSRRLHMQGYCLSGGIAHGKDSDSRLWSSLAIEYMEIPPFAEIEDSHLKSGIELLEKADFTVLCRFPMGKGNWRNLELARQSSSLLIVEGERDLSLIPPEGRSLYEELLKGSPVLPEEEIPGYIKSHK